METLIFHNNQPRHGNRNQQCNNLRLVENSSNQNFQNYLVGIATVQNLNKNTANARITDRSTPLMFAFPLI